MPYDDNDDDNDNDDNEDNDDNDDNDDDDNDDDADDDLKLGYLLLSSLQSICGKIARGATYEAICAENVVNE